MTTSIEDLVTNIDELNFKNVDEEYQSLKKEILNFENTEEFRLELVEKFYVMYPSQIQDIISSLFFMKTSMDTYLVHHFLEKILYESTVNPINKFVIAEYFNNLTMMEYLYEKEDLSILFRKKIIHLFLEDDTFFEKGKKYLFDILFNREVDPYERYSFIVDLEDVKNVHVLKDACLHVLESPLTLNRIAILCCQFMLNKSLYDTETMKMLTDRLLLIAKDEELDIYVRADAVDVLLTVDDKDVVREAILILQQLGTIGLNKFTIYENVQNVHTQSIEKSALEILEKLSQLSLPTYGVDRIKEILLEKTDDEKTREKIELAFTRINLDRSYYGTLQYTLRGILSKVYGYISKHDSSEELHIRLIEELSEGFNVCSTGLAFRLVNVLSGFGDFSIRISFEEQIIGNFSAMLNGLIMNIPNEYVKEDIIMQLSIPTEHFEQRKDFLEFLVQNIGKMRESLYVDFKEDVSESDFNEYFKKALIKYQGF